MKRLTKSKQIDICLRLIDIYKDNNKSTHDLTSIEDLIELEFKITTLNIPNLENIIKKNYEALHSKNDNTKFIKYLNKTGYRGFNGNHVSNYRAIKIKVLKESLKLIKKLPINYEIKEFSKKDYTFNVNGHFIEVYHNNALVIKWDNYNKRYLPGYSGYSQQDRDVFTVFHIGLEYPISDEK